MADLSARAGVILDGWQELILRAAMGERADATWAAKRIGVCVPRQNGKSQLLVARALAGALLFGERKIVISAHQQDTAREAFSKMMEIIEADANGWLRSRIRPNGIMQALNREAIKFTSGATMQFKARSGAGGKGFSSDCLMLDEAQILGPRAWVSINSTMSAMPNPQVWLLGTTPQVEDDSEVYESVRRAAVEGKSTSAAWCEWGADPDDETFDPASEYTRWSANPAWNTRINHEVVDGEFETYPAEKFAQDRLGVWASDSRARRLIPADLWASRGVEVAPEGVQSYGVAFSLDGSRVALAGARRHEGGVHVEVIDARTGPLESGIASLADWLAERWRRAARIELSGAAGAMPLSQALRDRGVPEHRNPDARVVRVASTADYTAACAMTWDAIKDGTFTHLASEGQAVLDASVAVCDMKKRGTSGAWGWEATTPDGDETPLEAVSLALYGARTTKRDPSRKQVVL